MCQERKRYQRESKINEILPGSAASTAGSVAASRREWIKPLCLVGHRGLLTDALFW